MKDEAPCVDWMDWQDERGRLRRLVTQSTCCQVNCDDINLVLSMTIHSATIPRDGASDERADPYDNVTPFFTHSVAPSSSIRGAESKWLSLIYFKA